MKMFCIFLSIPLIACCQINETKWIELHNKDYKNIVKKFYFTLYEKESTNKNLAEVYLDAALDTGILKKVKPYFKKLTGKLSKEEIYKIIDRAEVTDEGLQFGVYVELLISDYEKIYFELGSKDLPTIIQYIWLGDGTLFNSLISSDSFFVQKLLLVGIINDKDGFSNIREKPSINSKIVDKFTTEDFFYYTPDNANDWWLVYRQDDIKARVGYIHKSRIIKYSKMSDSIKEKITKKRQSY